MGMMETNANMTPAFLASGITSGITPILRCLFSGLQNKGFGLLSLIPTFPNSIVPCDGREIITMFQDF